MRDVELHPSLRDPHVRAPAGLLALFARAWANRFLILSLARRDVVGRYRGSWAGLAWSFFNPLLMLGVYTFVFSVVFKARWQEVGAGGIKNFAVVMFAGMIVHGILAECLQRAPALVMSNASYVKRVVFPLDALAWVTLVSALFHASISLAVLLCAQWLLVGPIPMTAWMVPLVIAPFALLSLGVIWIFAALGVYLRDIGQFTGILATALLFLAPILYPASALPESMRSWIYLNPISFVVDQVRNVLMYGVMPDWTGLGMYALVALLVAWIGFWGFQRAKAGFADVL